MPHAAPSPHKPQVKVSHLSGDVFVVCAVQDFKLVLPVAVRRGTQLTACECVELISEYGARTVIVVEAA